MFFYFIETKFRTIFCTYKHNCSFVEIKTNHTVQVHGVAAPADLV